MASIAMGVQMNGNTVQDARVVFGGISGKPYRERVVEDFLKGKTLGPQIVAEAQRIALANAAPLKYNAEKIDMAKGLLASGIERLSA
jgi:xanthine dehydrogenase YagS FAD-binding subunit